MQGFNIHHGIGKSLSLYKWMLKDRKDLVVPYSMFHIGCGGVLIEDNKILLVQEKRVSLCSLREILRAGLGSLEAELIMGKASNNVQKDNCFRS